MTQVIITGNCLCNSPLFLICLYSLSCLSPSILCCTTTKAFVCLSLHSCNANPTSVLSIKPQKSTLNSLFIRLDLLGSPKLFRVRWAMAQRNQWYWKVRVGGQHSQRATTLYRHSVISMKIHGKPKQFQAVSKSYFCPKISDKHSFHYILNCLLM